VLMLMRPTAVARMSSSCANKHTEKRNSRGDERQNKLKTITAPDGSSPAQVTAHTVPWRRARLDRG